MNTNLTQIPDLDQPLITALDSLHLHWIFQLLPWLAAIKILGKFVESNIQQWLTAKMAANVNRVGSDHDLFMRRLLSSKFYRGFNVASDLAFSVQLPCLQTYINMVSPKTTTQTTI